MKDPAQADTQAQEQPWVDAIYRIGERHQYEKVDGILLDAFTAGAMRTLDKALGPDARAKYRSMALPQAVNVTWKLVK